MNFDMLYKGKERKEFTEYSNQLIEAIKNLFDEISNHDHFHGHLNMFGDKLMAIEFNPLMKLSIVFDKQPNVSVISFERKYFDLTHVKLTNHQAIDFIKRILNDQIYVVEHQNRFLTALFPFFFVKIFDEKRFQKIKGKYLGKKRYKIYTGSKIIQGIDSL